MHLWFCVRARFEACEQILHEWVYMGKFLTLMQSSSEALHSTRLRPARCGRCDRQRTAEKERGRRWASRGWRYSYLPTEVIPFWFGKPSQWWIPSRSPGDTWQTWASSPSPGDCVSIPCRSSDPTGQHWCWSHSIRPGTPAESHTGISQKTTAHPLRVHRGPGSVRPELQPPCLRSCPALRPR